MGEFTEKTQSEIINGILIEIVANVDEVTDVNVGAVLRQLVEALGLEISDLYTEISNVYEGTRIDTATGTDLENLGALLGIERKDGTKATANVTFIRKTPAPSDFTIPAATIVSTQPNTAEEQLRFVVQADTTFLSSISAETHSFINGIYEYKLDERFISSISLLDGTASAAPFTFTESVDFEIVQNVSQILVDPDSIEEVDDCDATTGWAASAGAPAPVLDVVDFKQGTGSIKLGKTTIVSETAYYDKVLSPVEDATSKNAFLWIYIKDQTELDKINYLKMSVGSGGSITNTYNVKFFNSELVVGWNLYKVDFGGATTETLGFPNRVAMNYLRFTIVTNDVADVIASGDLKMDFWIFATSEDYLGDVVRFLASGTLPDDGTTWDVDYVPLSKEVACEAEFVGTKYNVTSLKVIYKVSFITNVDSVNNYVAMSGGTDIETDDDLRERIRNATQLVGKATVEALRQAVLAVDGVTSVVVDDMPLNTATDEPHLHISFASTPTIALDFEVAQDDGDFEITGTRGGPVTFIKNTDYFITDSVVNWVDDAKDPDDGTIPLVDYNYRWLGHVRIFVTGTSIPLPPSVATDIDTAIEDTRAAGIDVQWSEPVVVLVSVTCDIEVDTAEGFTFVEVGPEVEDAIEIYLNDKGAGDDVLLAELVELIMGTDGVINVVVSLPAADVVIDVDEVARPGIITVGLLP